LPGHLAGTMRILGHHDGYQLAAFVSGRQVVVVLVAAVIFIALLTGPIVGENLFDAFSAGGAKIAPAVIFLGLGVLIVGITLRIGILDVAGACLLGAVLLGAILINY